MKKALFIISILALQSCNQELMYSDNEILNLKKNDTIMMEGVLGSTISIIEKNDREKHVITLRMKKTIDEGYFDSQVYHYNVLKKYLYRKDGFEQY